MWVRRLTSTSVKKSAKFFARICIYFVGVRREMSTGSMKRTEYSVLEKFSVKMCQEYQWQSQSKQDTLWGNNRAAKYVLSLSTTILTLNLLTWKIWWAPNNASKWQMWFNSVFKGLKCMWKERRRVRDGVLRCVSGGNIIFGTEKNWFESQNESPCELCRASYRLCNRKLLSITRY
jgi:hypothetical protein